MQPRLKCLIDKKSKGQEEHFSAFILVIFGLIITILIVIVVLHQKVNTTTTLAEYSMVSSAKELTYKFVSCFSSDYFGLIDSNKFDSANTTIADCFEGEKVILTFEVKDLETDEVWNYAYIPPEITTPPEANYQPSSYKLFLPIKYSDGISNGVVYVEIYMY